MKLRRKILSFVLGIQFIIGPGSHSRAAATDVDYDFSDEPSYVTGGDDRSDGSKDGNCVGSGCGDQAGAGGRAEYDDQNAGGRYGGLDREDGRHDSAQGNHGEGSNGNGHGNHNQEYYHSREFLTSPENLREILKQDRDRGDGVIFVQDNKGDVYYPGTPPQNEQETDITDIYTNRQGDDYVKSADGKHLLPLKGLVKCAPDCAAYGYKEDWWDYAIYPPGSGSESSRYDAAVSFAQRQLIIKNGVEKARSLYGQRPAQMKAISEAKRLSNAAHHEYLTNPDRQRAEAIQRGAIAILSTMIDIGIGLSPLGWGKDAYELITGTSLVTGRSLSDTERIIAGLGVIIPGVGGMAVAGIHILQDIKSGEKAIANMLQVEKTLEAIGGLKTARIKEGKNLSEVAIIGRDMESVKAMDAQLNAVGVQTRTFESSEGALKALTAAGKEHPGGRIPYEEIPSTILYKENMSWVDKTIRDDITIIDIGNPKMLKERSRFYDDEVLKIFKGTNTR